MKKIVLIVSILMLTAFVSALAQDQSKAQPATKAVPPTEQGEKAIPATPSAHASKGMAKKAENMQKRDAKKAAMSAKRSAKREAAAARKDAKKSARHGH